MIIRKDFSHVKSHSILYNTNVQNFAKVETELKEVLIVSNKNFVDQDSQDATIIEYCPKVFDELRKLDEISHQELQQ